MHVVRIDVLPLSTRVGVGVLAFAAGNSISSGCCVRLWSIRLVAILRTTIPLWEMMIGLVETLVLAWLIGASIASIYNVGIRRHVMN